MIKGGREGTEVVEEIKILSFFSQSLFWEPGYRLHSGILQFPAPRPISLSSLTSISSLNDAILLIIDIVKCVAQMIYKMYEEDGSNLFFQMFIDICQSSTLASPFISLIFL